MNAFAVIIGIALAGIAAQAAVSLHTTGRLELSRFWYLALGLTLMLPPMGYPAAPASRTSESKSPNSHVQSAAHRGMEPRPLPGGPVRDEQAE